MNNRHRHLLYQAYKLFDVFVLIAAFLLATVLVNRPFAGDSFAQFLAYRVELSNSLIFVGLVFVWHLLLAWSGLYRSRRFSGLTREETLGIARGTALVALALTLAAFFFDVELVNLPFVALFWLTSTFAIAGSRFMIRLTLRAARRKGHNLRHVLMVGTNARAVRLARRLSASPNLGYHVLGFVDDEREHDPGFQSLDLHVVTDHKGFSNYLRRNIVDEVFIRLPIKSQYDRVSEIMDIARRHGLVVRYFPDFFALDKNMVVEKFEDFPMVTLGQNDLGLDSAVLKRFFDLVGSAMLLTVFTPLLMLLTIAIPLDSR